MMIITRFTRKINLFYLFFLRGIERNFFLPSEIRRNIFSLRQKCCLRLKNKPGAAAGLMITGESLSDRVFPSADRDDAAQDLFHRHESISLRAVAYGSARRRVVQIERVVRGEFGDEI